MHWVYLIYSEGYNRYYVGLSNSPNRRLKEHNIGKTKSTRPYRPWILVHSEGFSTFAEARKREKYLKSAAGRRWRKVNIRPRSSTG
ncbi:MAG: GIY-YIG nuclease family protein [Eudoraea sp.]|nr:GIY-YIG nuclease family protein [Eudoraea sp.]MBT8223603.1 GIY-YIG nuclease family protein [Eudoraea sp.]NNJ40413.1 GIY-YIG nuclease family protein [Eudoraea sp.]